MNRTNCKKCGTQWTGGINKCPECASQNNVKIKVVSFEELLATLLPPRQYQVYMYLEKGNRNCTLEGIRKHFKLKNQTSVAFAIDSLKKKGLLYRDKNSRELIITQIK